MSQHRLLERQIKRAARGRADGQPDVAALLEMIDTALYVVFSRSGHHIRPVAGERVACTPPLALKPVR
jgi:hypothetical protein